jgi:hypothetical protein
MNKIDNVTIHLPNSIRKLPILEINEGFTLNGYDIPKGFKTDGGTVPWVLRRCFPAISGYLPAAIVHDMDCLIANQRQCYSYRRRADSRFYDNCVNTLSRPKLESALLYAGVTVGSFIAYFRYRL